MLDLMKSLRAFFRSLTNQKERIRLNGDILSVDESVNDLFFSDSECSTLNSLSAPFAVSGPDRAAPKNLNDVNAKNADREGLWAQRRELWCRADSVDDDGKPVPMKKKQLEALVKKRAHETSLERKGITRESFYSIYEELVMQGRQLKKPLNLKDVIDVLESGWVVQGDRRRVLGYR